MAYNVLSNIEYILITNPFQNLQEIMPSSSKYKAETNARIYAHH